MPLKNRTTQRSAAAQLGIPQQTLQKNLGMRSSTRFLKPYLTGEGKARRLAWALRWVREGHGGSRTFDTMDNVVMADENWFFIKKNRARDTSWLTVKNCRCTSCSTNHT